MFSKMKKGGKGRSFTILRLRFSHQTEESNEEVVRLLRKEEQDEEDLSDIHEPATSEMPGYYPHVVPVRPVDPIRPQVLLSPDASNTLYVEGIPVDCTYREVSHIFRPFVGFQNVRLVNQAAGDLFALCFVDFATSNQAATALEALQGYKLDMSNGKSANLRLQFARSPGSRSGDGPLGKH